MKTLIELYDQPEVRHAARAYTDFNRNFKRPHFQETIRQLSLFATNDALQGHLDTFDEEAPVETATTLLGALPPRLLIENFGEPTTLWTMVNTRSESRTDRLATALGEFGYDPDLLHRVRTTTKMNNYPSSQVIR